jgi:hypothetical protein
MTGESRRAELYAMKATDPIELLALYRHMTGLGVDSQLPHHVSFNMMIDAILEHEQRQAVESHDKRA